MRAIANFGKIGKYAEPAIPKLIALTEANRPETRAFTAQALGENASFPKESVPALKKLLNDKDKDVRHTAAYALSKMGEYALPVYKEMLSNEDWYIRLKACHGLENIGSKAKPALAELRILINDKDQEVRRAVVKCIAVLEK
jgi:HEAT repeat protein